MAGIAGSLSTPRAVSYTHLDVYKRQVEILCLLKDVLRFTQALLDFLRGLPGALAVLLGLAGVFAGLLRVPGRLFECRAGLRRKLLDRAENGLPLACRFAGLRGQRFGLLRRFLRLRRRRRCLPGLFAGLRCKMCIRDTSQALHLD